MSRAHTLKTPDSLLIDGVMSYEAGDVHAALNKWQEALVIDPSHLTASRYTQFVESQLSISASSSRAEVRAAQERYHRQLTGDDSAPSPTLMPAAPQRSERHEVSSTDKITPNAEFAVPASPRASSLAEQAAAHAASQPLGRLTSSAEAAGLEELDEVDVLESVELEPNATPYVLMAPNDELNSELEPVDQLDASSQTAPFDPSEFASPDPTPPQPQAPASPAPSVRSPLRELLAQEAKSEAPTLWATEADAAELEAFQSQAPSTPQSTSRWSSLSEDQQTLPPQAEAPAEEPNEEVPTRPPQRATPPLSPIAQQALEGPSGPQTQADGLSIQALSRQLAQLHRSGQYDQAVQVAEELLTKDPQHAVAKRYIEEYRRQREAAKAKRRAERLESAPPQAISAQTPAQTPPAPTGRYTSPSAERSITGSAEGSAQAVTRELEAAPRPASRSNLAQATAQLSSALPIEDQHTSAPSELPPQGLTPDKLHLKPRVLLPFEQIKWQEFDHRAGFFVSQVDGETSYEDLITISGMRRDEALTLLDKLKAHRVIGH